MYTYTYIYKPHVDGNVKVGKTPRVHIYVHVHKYICSITMYRGKATDGQQCQSGAEHHEYMHIYICVIYTYLKVYVYMYIVAKPPEDGNVKVVQDALCTCINI